jgi:hypothetical protein
MIDLSSVTVKLYSFFSTGTWIFATISSSLVCVLYMLQLNVVYCTVNFQDVRCCWWLIHLCDSPLIWSTISLFIMSSCRHIQMWRSTPVYYSSKFMIGWLDFKRMTISFSYLGSLDQAADHSFDHSINQSVNQSTWGLRCCLAVCSWLYQLVQRLLIRHTLLLRHYVAHTMPVKCSDMWHFINHLVLEPRQESLPISVVCHQGLVSFTHVLLIDWPIHGL